MTMYIRGLARERERKRKRGIEKERIVAGKLVINFVGLLLLSGPLQATDRLNVWDSDALSAVGGVSRPPGQFYMGRAINGREPEIR